MAYQKTEKRDRFRGQREEKYTANGEKGKREFGKTRDSRQNGYYSDERDQDAGRGGERSFGRERNSSRRPGAYRGSREDFSPWGSGQHDSREDFSPRGSGKRYSREDFSPRGNGQRPGRAQEAERRPAPFRSPERATPRYDEEESVKKGYRDFEYREAPRASRPESALEEQEDRILCGRNPIREALRSGREIEKLLIQKGELSPSAREIVQTARAQKIMVQEVDKRRLDEIALHHQGMVAFAAAYAYAEVEDILNAAAERGEDPFIVILDGVTDPHNLGAIIRTASCAGAHGVIIPQHRSVGLTPAAVKASAGAIEHIKIARVTNLNRTIADLQKKGIWAYAVTMEGKDFEKVDFRGGTALVIGAEGEGISRLTAETCDLKVSLPMKGVMDSLNASVAAGIMMYRVLCCRRSR